MLRRPSTKLLCRYLSSSCSDQEKLKVESWIKSSEKNRELFNKLKTVWDVAGQVGEDWDYARSFERLKARIREKESTDGRGFRLYRVPQEPRRAFISPSAIVRIAAVLALLLGISYTTRYLKERVLERQVLEKARDFVIQEVQTKPGEQVTVNFTDGTKVVLNSATQLKYGTNPYGAREVYLEGEAYFEVIHSDAHPFIIHVGDGIIKDLGTKFDVKAWPDDKNTRVTVIEGIISIRPNGWTEKDVVVKHHQYSVISDGGVMTPPTYTNVSRDIEWMSGKQVFHNDAMSEVMKQIWRIYGIHCFVSDTSILSRRITTSFDNRDPAKRVLDIIALSLNLKYKISKDSVFFVPSRPPIRESEVKK